MPQIILSINAGSSSVKVSVYKTENGTPPEGPGNPIQIAEAVIEGLTAPPAKLKYQRGDYKVKGKEVGDEVQNQEDAFRWIVKWLTADEGLPEVQRLEDIRFTCHRVVHGGEYPESQVVDEEAYRHIETLSDLAPL